MTGYGKDATDVATAAIVGRFASPDRVTMRAEIAPVTEMFSPCQLSDHRVVGSGGSALPGVPGGTRTPLVAVATRRCARMPAPT